jgi:hypothetical protein
MSKKKSVLAQARAWATKNKLCGTQAFLRYVILNFTENLNQVSDEFVFKGGNLLWVYISTPRATVDLDLATLNANSHRQVRQLIEKACRFETEIHYSLGAFKEIEQEGKTGAALTIAYTTKQGAKNRFEVDIVYAIGTDFHEIESPVHAEVRIRSATMENIITDKLSACHRFGAGNTRMKDYDDLWRISQRAPLMNIKKLTDLLKARSVLPQLDSTWINPEIIRYWSAHRKKYIDLPDKLEVLFENVNRWLSDQLKGES